MRRCGRTFPLLSGVLAAGVLRAAPDREVQEELAAGAVGALAASGPGDRLPGAPLHWDGSRLTGTAVSVADAERADVLVLLAKGADGPVAAVVRRGDLGLRPQEAFDATRPLADVDVAVRPERVFAVDLEEALAVPLVATAAELVGTGTRLLDLAVTHALVREQFGKPIGSFQGIKHRLADCYVALERARSLTYAAAMLVEDRDATSTQRWRSALLAKAAAGEAASETARSCVQVHGALAMSWEHDAHLYLRRAWQSAALLGEPRACYAAAGALLVAGG